MIIILIYRKLKMTYLKKNSRKLLVAIILGINTDLAMAQSNNIDLDSILSAEASVSREPRVIAESLTSPTSESWSVHGQITYINQIKNNFNSPYEGSKSLLNSSNGDIGSSYTFTGTLFLGTRLWQGAELYYNPEVFQGIPFSGLSGLGGFNNGELQKGAAIPAIYYNARLFLKQTINLGGGTEFVDTGMNQLAGTLDKERIVLTYGTFSALDFFDANKYSHDPRTQFLNWSIMASGAYDYAASSRGYTYGAVVEYYKDYWALKVARFSMPISPNELNLDYSLKNQYGDQMELTHAHSINDQPGKIRALIFQNHGIMATYQDAINYGVQTGSIPDIISVRNSSQTKWGYGINLEQAITNDMGIFARWSWNDGQTETQAFTDISNSLSGGLSIHGTSWGRPKDFFGIGFAINGISSQEINYLSQGGSTMFIGDGKLNYQKEQIFETFYSFNIHKELSLTLDYQRIANPGYNADRGPVNFFGVRAHVEM